MLTSRKGDVNLRSRNAYDSVMNCFILLIYLFCKVKHILMCCTKEGLFINDIDMSNRV